MGFELTGATPDERLKELTEKLEQGVSEIFTSGRYAEYLSAMSKFHTYSFGQRHAHSHAKPGCISCGRVSHMEEEF